MSYGGYGQRGGEEPRPRVDISKMTPQERFDYAKTYKLNLPKGRGRTLSDICYEDGDDGLLYLDWLMGQQWISGTTRTALTNFLEWAEVAVDIERIKERRAIKGEKPAMPGKPRQDNAQQDAPE